MSEGGQGNTTTRVSRSELTGEGKGHMSCLAVSVATRLEAALFTDKYKQLSPKL